MNQPNLLSSADYADSLLTAKRAKNTLFLIILILLLAELALFFFMRYSKAMESDSADSHPWPAMIQYLLGLIDFLGIIAPALLSITLLLILGVQLVGRLLGTAKLTSAFFWSVALALLLFPWQAMLNNPANTTDPTAVGLGLKIPGVLYTWTELNHPKVGARFDASPMSALVILHWARFVAFPVLSVLILLVIQAKGDRGLRAALGNEISTETTPPSER